MIDDQLSKEIRALVSRVIKVPEGQIDIEANLFMDLGVDSLLGVEIFAALDKKYNLDIPEEKLKNISTLSDIVSLVQGLRAKN